MLKIILYLAIFAVVYGFVGPMFVSSTNNLAVIIGLILAIGTPVYIGYIERESIQKLISKLKG